MKKKLISTDTIHEEVYNIKEGIHRHHVATVQYRKRQTCVQCSCGNLYVKEGDIEQGDVTLRWIGETYD